jgi:hypothetical protein
VKSCIILIGSTPDRPTATSVPRTAKVYISALNSHRPTLRQKRPFRARRKISASSWYNLNGCVADGVQAGGGPRPLIRSKLILDRIAALPIPEIGRPLAPRFLVEPKSNKSDHLLLWLLASLTSCGNIGSSGSAPHSLTELLRCS